MGIMEASVRIGEGVIYVGVYVCGSLWEPRYVYACSGVRISVYVRHGGYVGGSRYRRVQA